MPVNVLGYIGKVGTMSVAVVCLALGGLLLIYSHTWYAFVWTMAKIAFPGSGVRVVMVNTEATDPLRAQYGLPDGTARNIALRALIVDRNDRVVATAWRDGHLQDYPAVAAPKDKPTRLGMIYLRALGWCEAAKAGGWILVAIAALQISYLLVARHTAGRRLPVVSYAPFEELIVALRADGLDGEADRLHSLLHRVAWTTGSELIGELGQEMRKLERERGTAFSAGTGAKMKAAFEMVKRVWPHFPR